MRRGAGKSGTELCEVWNPISSSSDLFHQELALTASLALSSVIKYAFLCLEQTPNCKNDNLCWLQTENSPACSTSEALICQEPELLPLFMLN